MSSSKLIQMEEIQTKNPKAIICASGLLNEQGGRLFINNLYKHWFMMRREYYLIIQSALTADNSMSLTYSEVVHIVYGVLRRELKAALHNFLSVYQYC